MPAAPEEFLGLKNRITSALSPALNFTFSRVNRRVSLRVSPKNELAPGAPMMLFRAREKMLAVVLHSQKHFCYNLFFGLRR
jgi:hypothetical protein